MLEVDSTLCTEIDDLQRQQVYKILSELEVVAWKTKYFGLEV